MHISQALLRVIGRSTIVRGAMIAAIVGTVTLGLNAQQADGTEGGHPMFNVPAPSTASLLAANDTTESIGYSSSVATPGPAEGSTFFSAPGVSAAMQPPPRRYGRRPVYADSSHNADGSAKYTFFGGAGVTIPTGGTHAYFSPSYDFQVGGGRNFNKKLAALVEFDWHNFGLQNSLTSALGSATGIYGELGVTDVGGHGHIWSFSVDPMYTFIQGEKSGAYVIGGAGFYHKVTDFTTPAIGTYCDPYYGCYQYEANQTFDSYVSNAAGFNGGVGFTYKPSRFGNEKFYAEARFVYTANDRRPYYVAATGTTNPTSNVNYFNAFPQNSAPTTFIPITFGVRF